MALGKTTSRCKSTRLRKFNMYFKHRCTL